MISRRGRAIALVVVVALIALVVRHKRSVEPPDAPPTTIAAFTVDYRIKVHAETLEVSHRDVSVRRPTDSRDMTLAAGASNLISGFVSTGTHLFGVNGTSVLDYGDQVAIAGPGDYRLQPILGDLVRLHLASRRATARVAGRACRVYRFGVPLGDQLKPEAPGEHADVCIDRDGIVLSERWFLNGKLLRDTEAIAVDTHPSPENVFTQPPGEMKANPTGIGAITKLSTAKPPHTGLAYWVAPKPMWDFRLTDRVRSTTTTTTSGSPELTDIAYIDVYRRSHDAIEVVHRELSAAGAPQAGVEKVRAGALGTGQVTLSDSGASIAFTSGKWVVTVRGALDVAHLRAFAATLRPHGP